MKRLLAIFLVLVLFAGAVTAAAIVVLDSDGAPAFTVSGRSVSQSNIDDELKALAENKPLRSELAKSSGAAATTTGSLPSALAASWIGLRINETVAAREVARQGFKTTAADRELAKTLAYQLFGNPKIVAAFPNDFRSDLINNLIPVALPVRAISANPSPALVEQAASQCPSGRYVSHILVATQAEADALLAQLNAGADFVTLAQQNSTDGSAAQGGELGCIDGQQFVEPFAAVAAAQPAGSVSAPVQTEYGFHLIKVTDNSTTALSDAILQTVLTGAIGARVSLDPRYGTWDRRTGSVTAPTASIPSAKSNSPVITGG